MRVEMYRKKPPVVTSRKTAEGPAGPETIVPFSNLTACSLTVVNYTYMKLGQNAKKLNILY